jgi:PTS system cellobiose-specific IIB component
MKILVVCGVGASSTYIARRMRETAESRGLHLDIRAGAESDLAIGLAGIDALLIGPHLAGLYDDIRAHADQAGIGVVLLPPTIFTAGDGGVALDLALGAAGARP